MEVIITEWGLQSYLDLKAQAVFTDQNYWGILRPDVELLKTHDPFNPQDPKFSNGKFWGPATFKGSLIQKGYKMKWHNLGPGKVQFRLCVVIAETDIDGQKEVRAFLCNAYVKNNKTELREMANLKTKIRKILDGNYVYRGKL